MNVSELNKFCSLFRLSFGTLKFLFIDFQLLASFSKHNAGCITAGFKENKAPHIVSPGEDVSFKVMLTHIPQTESVHLSIEKNGGKRLNVRLIGPIPIGYGV